MDDYLLQKITETQSDSPLARHTGDRSHQNTSNGDVNRNHNQHPGKKKSNDKSQQVNANIDDRFKAVSGDVSGHRRPANNSRIDPWISNYVLKILKSRSTISKYHPKEAPMIEILDRGGPFWNYKKLTNGSDPKDLEGWLLVSDGNHSIKVWMTSKCREEIWQQVKTSEAKPMYAFYGYSRQQCGLLKDFRLKPIQVTFGHHSSTSTTYCQLLCDSFHCLQQMQSMVGVNPSNIKNVNDDLEVKYAFQSYCRFHTSGIRLGNVKDAVDNPELCAKIMQKAHQQHQVEEEERAKANSRNKDNNDDIDYMGSVSDSAILALNSQQSKQSPDPKANNYKKETIVEEQEEEDDDGLPSMNIQDMLASPTQEEKEDVSSSGFHPPLHQPSIADAPVGLEMEAEKENQQAKDDGDDDSVIEVETKSPATKTPRKRSIATPNNPRHKRIKFRQKADWPNLPAFTALCKQLGDDTRKVVDMPEFQQPRVSLKGDGFRQWLDKLGY